MDQIQSREPSRLRPVYAVDRQTAARVGGAETVQPG